MLTPFRFSFFVCAPFLLLQVTFCFHLPISNTLHHLLSSFQIPLAPLLLLIVFTVLKLLLIWLRQYWAWQLLFTGWNPVAFKNASCQISVLYLILLLFFSRFLQFRILFQKLQDRKVLMIRIIFSLALLFTFFTLPSLFQFLLKFFYRFVLV